jgi:hypothetical protein
MRYFLWIIGVTLDLAAISIVIFALRSRDFRFALCRPISLVGRVVLRSLVLLALFCTIAQMTVWSDNRNWIHGVAPLNCAGVFISFSVCARAAYLWWKRPRNK